MWNEALRCSVFKHTYKNQLLWRKISRNLCLLNQARQLIMSYKALRNQTDLVVGLSPGGQTAEMVSLTDPLASDKLSNKELFNQKMWIKYHSPSPQETEELLSTFPHPEQLMDSVSNMLARADEDCVTRLVVKERLRGYYWTANLILSWPLQVSVVGINPEKNQAVRAAHLLMCNQLRMFGLIFKDEQEDWVPMSCDKVIMLLETLSDTGESIFGCYKGKGFKIVLEQIKDSKRCSSEHKSDIDLISPMKMADNPSKKFRVGSLFKQKYTECDDSKKAAVSCQNRDNYSNNVSLNLREELDTGLASVVRGLMIVDPVADSANKSKWLCTVHVGWPFRVTVQAKGLSLPAAQMRGIMVLAIKMKVIGLLTVFNNAISSDRLEKLMLLHKHNLWSQSLKELHTQTQVRSCGAEAELFCDASLTGFGAFLTLNDVEKVSWLSENWSDYSTSLPHLFITKRNMESLMAEMYAIVTAVFTWKHLLRSRQIILYNDNLMILSLLRYPHSDSLFKYESASISSSMQHLVNILQTTCQTYSIKMQVQWLTREENWLADKLSRNDTATFFAAMPGATFIQTKAKKLSVRPDPEK